MSEYDLKKSEKIGQLYPVLLDAKGNVIDGFHRLEVNPNWKTQKLEKIDTEEKLLIARAVSNWNRRQVSKEEKEEWINRLAEIYKKEDSNRSGSIIQRLVEATGLSDRTIGIYLEDKYKDRIFKEKKGVPIIPASERIEHIGGKQLVERHREEVLAEETPKIKEELSRDVEFIREVIEKAPEFVPNLPKRTIERAKKLVEPKEMIVQEGTIYTVGEYECPNCKRHYWIRCNGRKDWVE
jgi:hypothetical protein